MFKTLKEAQTWIESITKFGEKYDLSRMRLACAMLDHPEKKFQSIHIGGTNGKGSTVNFLKNILTDAGYRVGTYTSPYVVHFNERITLEEQMIEDTLFLEHLNRIHVFEKNFMALHQDQLTFFELLTLVAFNVFAEAELDYAIIEVGLGGLLDATNVITPLISAITSIGYDHMNVLGNTLSSILSNKLGIAKPNIPLVAGFEQKHLIKLTKHYCLDHAIPLDIVREQAQEISHFDGDVQHFYFRGTPYRLNLWGLHQVQNAKVALMTTERLSQLGLSIPLEAKQSGIERTQWPGRFERFGSIILEGAHNQNGMEAAVSTLQHYFKDEPLTVVFTAMQDKDITAMLRLIEPCASQIIFTEIAYPRCEKAQNLKAMSPHPNAIAVKDRSTLLNIIKTAAETERVFITGSLYFISDIRADIVKLFAPHSRT